MLEFLPFGAGVLLGLLLTVIGQHRRRWLSLPVACVPAGALFSWISGELSSGLWPLFVSVDALLVWAGAVLALTVEATRRRLA